MIKIHTPWLLICNLKLKLIISKQRVSISVPLQLIRKSTTLSLSNPCSLPAQDTLISKPYSRRVVRQARDRVFATGPSNWPYVRVGTSKFFLVEPRNFLILRVFKPKFQNSSGWVPTSSAEVSIQETSVRDWTMVLHLRKNEFQPQVPRHVEGRRV